MNFERLIRAQCGVVRMLEHRDEMNAAIHLSEVRYSPVTDAAKEVYTALLDLQRLYYSIDTVPDSAEPSFVSSEKVDHVTDGEFPHKFVRFAGSSLCNVRNCASDKEDFASPEETAQHSIHQVDR